MHLTELMVLCYQPLHRIECVSHVALGGLGSFIPLSSLILLAHGVSYMLQDLHQTCQKPEIVL